MSKNFDEWLDTIPDGGMFAPHHLAVGLDVLFPRTLAREMFKEIIRFHDSIVNGEPGTIKMEIKIPPERKKRAAKEVSLK